MKSWPFRCLAKLYPKAWRERYADEVNDLSAELLAAHEVTRPRLALELVRSGFAERLHSLNRARFVAALSASAAVVVLLVAALLATNGFGLGATTSPRVTPVGWDSMGYRDAQLSFPPSFETVTSMPGGIFSVDVPSWSFASGETCVGPSRGTVVCLLPLGQVSPAYTGEQPTVINGVTVYRDGKGDYYAPSLHIEVTASGPMAHRIVDTLTRNRIPGCAHALSCGSITMTEG
jgi:hypothetical protein